MSTRSEKMEEISELCRLNGKGKGNLVGVDGNAFSLIGYTTKKLKQAGWCREDIKIVTDFAMEGNYMELIIVLSSTLSETEGYDYG